MNNESKVVIVIYFSYLDNFFLPHGKSCDLRGLGILGELVVSLQT